MKLRWPIVSIWICFLAIGSALAQDLSYPSYNIGNPTYLEIWVNPNTGSDSNSGNNRGAALRTLTAAWQRIPQGNALTRGYKILLTPGNYPESSIPNYWEDRHGNAANPILIQSSDGPGTVILQGDINAYDLDYFYLVGLSIIPEPAGDTFHCEQCDHLLLRGMIFDGGNRVAHETIKINQSKYVYIEDSDVRGSDENNIDFVAVQYGHIVRNKIHAANDWCVYVKGGSAQILLEGNSIYDCGTGGFTAGQGSGFEFMTTPWLHYEAYDIKFINNIIYNTIGAGFGVNGGYNILLAHNTLYKVGRNSHTIEVVYGYRSCDGDVGRCNSYLSSGGWGTNQIGTEGEFVPNKNVFIYNNLIYNPVGFESQYSHFAVYGPRSTSIGSNLPSVVVTDANLQIKGNVIWNGSVSHALGIEESDQGCQPSNVTCNATQLVSENFINTHQPSFIDLGSNDFRIASDSPVQSLTPSTIGSFAGADRPSPPLAPVGNLNNNVDRDYANTIRASRNRIGAYAGSLRSLTEADGYLPWNSFLGMVNIAELVNKGSSAINILLTVYDTSGQAISQARVNLASHAQQDIILNDLVGFRTNSYGLVALDCSSTDMDARLAVYRINTRTNNFDFTFASPLRDPTSGTSSISFNTMQPSGNINDRNLLVTNWLSITNPDPLASHSFTVFRYDENGDLLASRRVNVTPFGRVDIEGGHENPGRLRIGLNQIVPDDEHSPYFANIVRYGMDHSIVKDFQFAYPITSASGGDLGQFIPVSNGGGAQNWVEIANVSEQPVNVEIKSYDNAGDEIGAVSRVRILPHSQHHFYASQYLANGASGLVSITSTIPNTIVVHSLFYFFNSSRSIAAMYGLKSLELSAGRASGSYNLFLGMANWLKIVNLSPVSKTATLRLYFGSTTIKEQSYTLPALGTFELPLHEASSFNTISNSYGLVEVVGDGISSHLLRIRPLGNEINFIFPTTVH